ncbi:Phosphoribosylamine--glycine ligase [Fulvivirga imtechensis AK7]|uniref:Phosphoribosylamine--glycine ligase n=1 Tax=Fulvivirga imtechensis AK7 TaxID=1237149 RepID=L8JT68_9BACT|nr:phosphoribosylamine--glycine ligase [Fulvivirga imtechensis]ELR71408.1 Phosphoribosylamine--glycine ligase [Fulvivirga imtechensis AK7]
MNILILGSGGREHMLAMKIAESEKCSRLFVAPGNAGTDQVAENVPLKVDDFPAIGNFVIENNIGLVVVGPEDPLVKGIRDYFHTDSALRKIALIGPGKAGARLEGSKDFSKAFMEKYGIPTAKSKTFTAATIDEGLIYLETCAMPIVLKADGLAAGKGVIIAQNIAEAQETLKSMLLEKQFGQASEKVLIEEFMDGIELSVFVLTDGKDYVLLPEAKDYKRIGEGDTGLNTGGMGAVSPVSFANSTFINKVKEKIIVPTIEGLREEGIDYKGFIFIGLMNVAGEPKVIEYNVRMGDPETQAVFPRIQSDVVELLYAAAQGRLSEIQLETDDLTAVTVVLVAGGYPGSYEKGDTIKGLPDVTEALVVHAGTKHEGYELLTNGGRVLAITGQGDTLEEALEKAYDAVNRISWKGMYFRKDIGKDILALQID